MDILSNLKPAEGSVKKRKRVGRGEGSGHGKTACRGENGQKSRSGHKFRAWFEGGQMPLQRRVPKFGFKNVNRIEYQPVNIEDLVELSKKIELTEGKINPQILFENRLIRKKSLPVKILGQGELNTKLIVEAHAFSKSALDKIQAAGGKAIILN